MPDQGQRNRTGNDASDRIENDQVRGRAEGEDEFDDVTEDIDDEGQDDEEDEEIF